MMKQASLINETGFMGTWSYIAKYLRIHCQVS